MKACVRGSRNSASGAVFAVGCTISGELVPVARASTARVIVCGSRRWHDRQTIADRLHELVLERGWKYPDPVIVHGAARGADRLADDEAGKAGLLTEAHPANWERYGKRAGIIRNEEMARLGAVLCLAFWDGRSTGTQHMTETAARHGIPVEVVRGPSSSRAGGRERPHTDSRHGYRADSERGGLA